MQEIKKLLYTWDNRTSCSKKQFQSLLGSLLYISKCVSYSRSFLNRLLQNFRDYNAKKISEESKRDIAWLKKFLQKFNGTTFFTKEPINKAVHLDACLTGIGAIFKLIYTAKIPQNFKHCCIATLEMLNISVALKVWAKAWAGLRIEIYCDNAAVVAVLQSGRTRDADLATISRNIFMLAAKFDIFLKISHVPVKHNVIADLLSRWQGSIQNIEILSQLVPKAQWVDVPEDIFMLDTEI